MKTLMEQKYFKIQAMITALFSKSKAKSPLARCKTDRENSLSDFNFNNHKNVICVGHEDFPDDTDGDYFSPSKWYDN
ncbi:MAG: hypothetical protein M0Q21_11415 [Ignavibacteriaceae bacterium]|nr:hypothetical protein [Ignavibacteriaceae bacterium]